MSDEPVIRFIVPAINRTPKALRHLIAQYLSAYLRESDIQNEQISLADFAFQLLAHAHRENEYRDIQ